MDIAGSPSGSGPIYYYEIDSEDKIVAANDNWDSFAIENDGQDFLFEKIKGSSVWDHISDPATTELYRRIFGAAREGHPVQFFLRCDSPAVRRMLHVSVSPTGEGRVRVSTLLFRADEREPLDLRAAPDEDADALKVCTWCSKFELGENEWREIEAAAAAFEEGDVPVKHKMTHAICPPCLEQIERQLTFSKN